MTLGPRTVDDLHADDRALLDGLATHQGRLAAREDEAADGRDHGQADHDDEQVGQRHVAEVAEHGLPELAALEVAGGGQVPTGGAEQHPEEGEPPAVAAVIFRRLKLLAPVAASVRRSLAVSARMSPTVMARMASASAMPKTVAQLTTCHELGSSFLDSMVNCSVEAVALASLIWAAVRGPAEEISHPERDAWFWRWTCERACSVTRVLGADVPEGNCGRYWMTGLARHELGGHGSVVPSSGRDRSAGRSGGRSWGAGIAPDHLHVAQRVEARAHGEEVGLGIDLARRDAERPQQLGRGHVDRPAELEVVADLGVLQPDRSQLEGDGTVGGTEGASDAVGHARLRGHRGDLRGRRTGLGPSGP